MQTPSLGQTAIGERADRSTEAASLLDKVLGIDEESDLPRVRAQGSRVPLWPLRLLRGARGVSVEVSTKGEKKSSTSMLNPPPPPHQQSPVLSGGSASRHTRWVRSHWSWERGMWQAQQGL